METFLTILSYVGAGFLGIFLQTLIGAFKHFVDWQPFSKPLAIKKQDNGSFAVMIQQNFGKWVWGIILLVTVAVLIAFMPELAEAIATEFKFDLNNNPKGFFLFGIGIGGIIKRDKK